eukprot:13479430-Heterocapsa_arctica.AAC.1
MTDKLNKLKTKTKWHACGQSGDWVGDNECPQRGMSSGGKVSYAGRSGGFLRRAGLAVTTLSMLLKVVIAIQINDFNGWNDNNFNGNYMDVFDDKFYDQFGLNMLNIQSNDVNDSRPIMVESEQAIPVDIAGKACALRFQRMESKTPMLSSRQLYDLD